MDLPPEMVPAKVVSIGKGDAPVLKLKRGKLKDTALGKKLKPVVQRAWSRRPLRPRAPH